jgi:putative hydrolase of the HAD superfamily
VNSGRILAVTLDVGGTLIEPYPSVGHVYAATALRYLGQVFDPAVLNENFREAWNSRGLFDYSERGWLELVRKTFVDVEVGDEFFREIYTDFAKGSAWRIFPDVLPCLKALREQEVPVVLISNWDARLRPLLRDLGFEPYFQHLVVSSEVGDPKPDARIFEAAIKLLGCDRDRILHVGDGREEDYEGALRVGLRALWLVRDGEPAGPCQINSLGKLAVECAGD